MSPTSSSEELAALLLNTTIKSLRIEGKDAKLDDIVAAPTSEIKSASIVAPKGAGKTTFLHWFLHFYLPGQISRRSRFSLLPMIFDMRVRVGIGEISDAQYITGKILEFVNDQLDIYYGFADALRDQELFYEIYYPRELEVCAAYLNTMGVGSKVAEFGSDRYMKQMDVMSRLKENRKEDYVKSKIDYYRRSNPANILLLALDNIDHHFANDPHQAVVCLQRVCNLLRVHTIITLRDTSVLDTAAFTGSGAWLTPKTFFLDELDIGELGGKRIEHVKHITTEAALADEEQEFLSDLVSRAFGRKTSLSNESSYNFQMAWEWLRNLSNSDYRVTLNTLSRTLCSYHLFDKDFEKERYDLVIRYDTQHGINIKRLKTAFINGLSVYYSENYSNTNVVNLFEAGRSDYIFNYIIRLKLLQYLHKLSARFHLGETMHKLKNIIGRGGEVCVDDAIRLFVRKGLLTIFSRGTKINPMSDGIENITVSQLGDLDAVVSPNGNFHLEKLIHDDIYLDEMKYATDLHEQNYADVFTCEVERTARARKESTQRFIEFLGIQEMYSGPLGKNLGVSDIMENVRSSYEYQKKVESQYFRTR